MPLYGIGQHGTRGPAHVDPYKPTAAKYETWSRGHSAEQDTAMLASGRETCGAIFLPAGFVVNSITMLSGTTAGVNMTHQWFTLRSSSQNGLTQGGLLAVTTDDTSTAWAGNATKTLNLAASPGPYTITVDGLYYLGCVVTATGNVPSFSCRWNSTSTVMVSGISPQLCYIDVGGGLTDPSSALNPSGNFTVADRWVYGWVA